MKDLNLTGSLRKVHALPGFGGIAQLVERLVRKCFEAKSAVGTDRVSKGLSL